MRKALWYVFSRGVSEQEKSITVNWEWLRGMLVHEVIHKLAHDVYIHSKLPFPVPFQILVEEEVTNEVTRIKATVLVEEEDLP